MKPVSVVAFLLVFSFSSSTENLQNFYLFVSLVMFSLSCNMLCNNVIKLLLFFSVGHVAGYLPLLNSRNIAKIILMYFLNKYIGFCACFLWLKYLIKS